MSQRATLSSASHHRLGFAEALALSGDRFHFVTATERGVQIDVPAGWASAWWVLRGSLGVQSPQFNGDVPPGGRGRAPAAGAGAG
ncbi:MAG: esterase-like activity of phytase family protein, partial [Rhizobium sp.]|nr:esterase-like activity of phytase family protein [Rhizobium sp.]